MTEAEKEVLTIATASLIGAGLLGGVAGYGLGRESPSCVVETKPTTNTTIYGGQTIINGKDVKVNSSD